MTLKQELENYLRACYGNPPAIDQTQAEEIEQAFFAGAMVTINSMRQMSALPMEVATEQLSGLESEILDANFKRASELTKRGIAKGS